ncbi:MAG: hypothetical protein LBJ73_03790 [Rickettsiales bacterium]|jgi:hypothetical protein|nr:hypothetical protein [Rickettsiales bacterium]
MKKFILFGMMVVLTACGEPDNSPAYVQSAKTDVRNAIVANIIQDTHFKCFSIQDVVTTIWTMACFMDNEPNPTPILLYAVHELPSDINPPFTYQLVALNGKAIQYKDKPAFKMFKITRGEDVTMNVRVSEIIQLYQEAYFNK